MLNCTLSLISSRPERICFFMLLFLFLRNYILFVVYRIPFSDSFLSLPLFIHVFCRCKNIIHRCPHWNFSVLPRLCLQANFNHRLSQYLTNLMHKICFTVGFISCLYMFRAHVLIIRRSKLHYTASGIITPTDMMIPDAV